MLKTYTLLGANMGRRPKSGAGQHLYYELQIGVVCDVLYAKRTGFCAPCLLGGLKWFPCHRVTVTGSNPVGCTISNTTILQRTVSFVKRKSGSRYHPSGSGGKQRHPLCTFHIFLAPPFLLGLVATTSWESFYFQFLTAAPL